MDANASAILCAFTYDCVSYGLSPPETSTPVSYTHLAGYMLRIDCWEAENDLKTTPGSDCALNALAIDKPLEYAKLYLDETMQIWVDAEDSLELW